ncbi:MAG TPA: polysaccharide deacetylase family protein [Clostridiaceae bacterium]|nr:polysaccharide deacetylase family protein [Clostridiaceae bacterium]
MITESTADTYLAATTSSDTIVETDKPKPATAKSSATESPATKAPAKVKVGTKYIAITFDDGPSRHTKRLLNALAKRGDKVTFFVLGSLVDGKNGHLVSRATKAGHEIGNHSYTHKSLTKLSVSQIKSELSRTDKAVIKRTGKNPP